MTENYENVREQRAYISYLIRLWRVTAGEKKTWRASLESPHTGEQVGFANLEELCRFLWEQIGGRPDSGEGGECL